MTCQSVLQRMIQQNMIECLLHKIPFLWKPYSMYESKLGVAFLIAAQSNGDCHFSLKVPFQDTQLFQYQKVIYFFIFIFAFKIFVGASAAALPKSGKFSNKCSPSAIIMEVLCMNCSVLVSLSACCYTEQESRQVVF